MNNKYYIEIIKLTRSGSIYDVNRTKYLLVTKFSSTNAKVH